MSDRWRGSYDDWKTTPPEDRDPQPERQTDPGECRLCHGSGVIVCTQYGRYLGPGPLPDPPPARMWEADCPSCGGAGEIIEEEVGE